MPRLSARSSTYRRYDGERVFADDTGRLWIAASMDDAVVFTCISDGRGASRALAVDFARLDASVGDDLLRAWLDQAPRIGTLP
jgi:hypothetical protein